MSYCSTGHLAQRAIEKERKAKLKHKSQEALKKKTKLGKKKTSS